MVIGNAYNDYRTDVLQSQDAFSIGLARPIRRFVCLNIGTAADVRVGRDWNKLSAIHYWEIHLHDVVVRKESILCFWINKYKNSKIDLFILLKTTSLYK